MLENYLNTKQAAEVIGCTDANVRRMLLDGRLKGKKVSARGWMVPRAEAEKAAKNPSFVGRPRKRAS